MNDARRTPAELCRLLGLPPVSGGEADKADAAWPLQAPEPYLARIRRGDPLDPLLLQVMPQAAELAEVAGFSTDPLGEADARRGPTLLQKYQGRVLMVTTGACAVHCRFCFRRHFWSNADPANHPPHCHGGALEIKAAIEQIAADRSIHEIILSGGDPLTLEDRKLGELTEELAGIPHLNRLRIHTRLPIMIPGRINDGLIRAIRQSRLTTIMVIHVNHPAEIDEEVALAFGRLVDAGVPLLSQTVLLRGVNDRIDVLAELCERLVDLRTMPYYLHQLDPVAGAAHFEVPEPIGRRLIAELRARLPGYAVPRYVRETPGGMCKEILE